MSVETVVTKFPNKDTFENMGTILARIAGRLEDPNNFYETNFMTVKRNVQAGLGQKMYPVGTEFIGYKASTATAALGVHTGITAVSITAETFLSAIDNIDTKVRTFSYLGAWYYRGSVVNMADYGLTLTGTPANGDSVLVTMSCTKVIWTVLAHNHHQTVNSAAYTMTLKMKWLYGTSTAYKDFNVDSPVGAFYYRSESTALAAGTYYFTLDHAYGQWRNGNYQFTLTNSLPHGGQLCFSGTTSTALTSLTVNVYSNGYADSTIAEQCAITSGNSGTSLGTLGTDLNELDRLDYASDNYAQSAIRQFLNSDKTVGNVCSQQAPYDRRPTWETGSDSAYNGFLHGMSKDFINALATTIVPCRTNDYFETNSLDGTTFTIDQTYNVYDKVFLLSRGEIWGTYDSSDLKDGTILDYYENMTNKKRIEYDSFGVAHYALTRTPVDLIVDDGNKYRIDSTSGEVVANDSNVGIVAACVIA